MLASNSAAPETVTVESREIHNHRPLFRRFAAHQTYTPLPKHQGKVWALSSLNLGTTKNNRSISMPNIICKIK